MKHSHFRLKVTVAAGVLLGLSQLAFAGFTGQSDIIGGTNVSSNDPVAETTVALVGKEAGKTYICSGSILANDLIVTAGHCLGTHAQIKIVFRTDISHGTGTVVDMVAGVRPSNFDTSRALDAMDIALISFKGGLPPGYYPAKLMGAQNDLRDGETVTLAGYGITVATPKAKSDNGAGTLRETTVNILRAQYGQTEAVVDQSHGHGACFGDSGGPAFKTSGQELLLFGVTSRTPGCARASIYTNILAHMAWLKSAASHLRGKK